MDFNPFLVSVDAADHWLKDSLDLSPRISKVSIGRREPTNLSAVEYLFDSELDTHVRLAESPTAFEDVEPGRFAQHLELPDMQSLLDWCNLYLHLWSDRKAYRAAAATAGD